MRICSTGKLAAMGTRSWPTATRRATSSRAPGATLAPLAGVIPSTWAAMVQMRPSGAPSSLAAYTVSVPCRSIAAVTRPAARARTRSARPSP